jgi:hypothetical protein
MTISTELAYYGFDLLGADDTRHLTRLNQISTSIARLFPNYTTLDRIIYYNLPNFAYCQEDNNRLLNSIETFMAYSDFYPCMLKKISDIYLYTAFDSSDLKDFLALMKSHNIGVFYESYYLIGGDQNHNITEVWRDTYLFDELV